MTEAIIILLAIFVIWFIVGKVAFHRLNQKYNEPPQLSNWMIFVIFAYITVAYPCVVIAQKLRRNGN